MVENPIVFGKQQGMHGYGDDAPRIVPRRIHHCSNQLNVVFDMLNHVEQQDVAHVFNIECGIRQLAHKLYLSIAKLARFGQGRIDPYPTNALPS